MSAIHSCSDCEGQNSPVNRRQFIRVLSLAGAAAATGVGSGLIGEGQARALAQGVPATNSENLVKKLYASLNPMQREEVCFDWDYQDDRGLLRTHVSNNWNITDASKLNVGGDFFTADQREMIREIFLGLYHPDWHPRILKQLQDDAGGYGKSQTIALFGKPDSGKFEFVMTGRHLTIRCDGDSTEHMAFGGPIFYGHAASGFNEQVGHPGNVFWYQAQKANALFQMLDGKQREKSLVELTPHESADPRVATRRSVGRSERARPPGAGCSPRAVSRGGSKGGPPSAGSAGWAGGLPAVVLPQGQRWKFARPGRRRRVGLLATGRTIVCLALSGNPARPRLGQRGGRFHGQIECQGLRVGWPEDPTPAGGSSAGHGLQPMSGASPWVMCPDSSFTISGETPGFFSPPDPA